MSPKATIPSSAKGLSGSSHEERDDRESSDGASPAGHSHGGAGHSHAPADFNRAFVVGIALNITFVATEALYGLSAHSLALISDAGHNLSDVLGLVLAWGAMRLSRSRPTDRRTYGYRRSSILAALGNAALLLLVTGAVTWEAIRRLAHPAPVVAMTIVWVAAAGIVINGATAMMFFSGRGHDVNIRGAFLHMASDALVAAGVVVAGLTIRATGWLWVDPVVSIAIGAIITLGTWGLLRESLNLAMDAVPSHVDPVAVRSFLDAVPGVHTVHDLHIWAMSTTETALTVHLVAPQNDFDDRKLIALTDELRTKFRIGHSPFSWSTGTTVIHAFRDRTRPCDWRALRQRIPPFVGDARVVDPLNMFLCPKPPISVSAAPR
jgi:cobalt-zinc-cadmium efflux system protein